MLDISAYKDYVEGASAGDDLEQFPLRKVLVPTDLPGA